MRVEGHKLIAECSAYDFKKELERKKIRDWLKSISTYANTEGGSLSFGVQNDGHCRRAGQSAERGRLHQLEGQRSPRPFA